MRLLTLTLSVVMVTSFMLVGVTVSEYDPWCDLDDSGEIDIFDVVDVANKYSTTGTPTRNVTVTNFPTEPEPKTIVVVQNYTLTASDYGKIFAVANIEGYRYVSIFVTYYRPFANSPEIRFYPSCMNITSGHDGFQSHDRSIKTSTTSTKWEYRASIGFEVGAPYLGCIAYISNGSIELTIVLYCYN